VRARSIGAALLAAVLTATAPASDAGFGRAVFEQRRDPVPVRSLDEATQEQFDLGQALYNTTWVTAGTPRAKRRDGLGPLFVAPSCDACHNNGARGRGPFRAGEPPGSFVMQLSGSDVAAYGHVLNTSALKGFEPEGAITVAYVVREGRHADGSTWTLQQPRYHLTLAHGPLDGRTVLRPRIGPALFGVGLLEGVPRAELDRIRRGQPRSVRGLLPSGRFGWQALVPTIRAQTGLALSREMGLTSHEAPADDCAPVSRACAMAANGGHPEVNPAFLSAMVTFQRELAVPAPGSAPLAKATFERIGCAGCHASKVRTVTDDGLREIAPYSDLLVHDLGPGLADRRVDGQTVRTLWRTAPLWGLRHALELGELALLHDGRARSIEEAILWHGGQASPSRRAFLRLPSAERQRLLDWLGSL
jgi:CxxC motif-containing protein (DUF1111 family)